MLDFPVSSAPDLCPRAPRSACQYSVTVQRGMSRTNGVLLNISASGALLKMGTDEEVGSTILLLMRFNLPDQGRLYVSISARVCRKSETDGAISYGIQWLQATCDDKPEGLRHLVEKILVGTTGRIQVHRNREHTERIAYTFDFASLKDITQHALDFFSKNPGVSVSSSMTSVQKSPALEEIDNQETVSTSSSVTKVSESTTQSPHKSGPGAQAEQAVATAKMAPIIQETPNITRAEEEKTVSSTNNVFAMGGSDLGPSPVHTESVTKNTLPEPPEPATAPSPEIVASLKDNHEVPEVLSEPATDIAKLEEVPQSIGSNIAHSTPSQDSKDAASSEPPPVEGMTKDRRTSKRHKQTHQLVTNMVIRGNETPVVIRNMSRGGALVQTRHQPPEMNSTLTLKIESPQTKRAVRINGSVVRIVDQASRNCLFAVRFIKPMHRGHAIELKRFFESILPN